MSFWSLRTDQKSVKEDSSEGKENLRFTLLIKTLLQNFEYLSSK